MFIVDKKNGVAGYGKVTEDGNRRIKKQSSLGEQMALGFTVQTTYDYDKFFNLKGNRPVRKLHKKRLLKSIKERDLGIPIIVNEKMEIVDGQHRFVCWRELGNPVAYIVKEGYGLDEAKRLNMNLKTWTTDDYIDAQIEFNNSNYILYRKFKEQYKLTQSSAMAIAVDRTGGETFLKDFQDGKYKFDMSEYKVACKIAEKISQSGEYYDGWKRRGYVRAMVTLMQNPEFNSDEYIKKLSYQREKMYNATNQTAYIDIIMSIYNYNRRHKVKF